MTMQIDTLNEFNILTQSQYEKLKANGQTKPNDIYMTTIEGTPLTKEKADTLYTTPDYVAQNGGKIDSISVNTVKQPITGKNVDLTIPLIKTFKNVTVAKSAFASNSTISQCPYKANVALTGVDDTYSPLVNFDTDIQFSGIQWVADCGLNTLILYASKIPSDSFIIPVVICTKIT